MVSVPSTEHRIRLHLLASLIGLALLSSACTGSGPVSGGGGTQQTTATVHELTSIATLRDAFNADAGSPRLILIVSPT